MDSLQSEVAGLTIKLQEKEDEIKALREEMAKTTEKPWKMQLQQKKYATKLSVINENILACENALLENFHLATLVEGLQREIEMLTHKVDFFCKTEVNLTNLTCVLHLSTSFNVQSYLCTPSFNVDSLKLPSEGCTGT